MKKLLAPLILFAVAFGTSQLPALADFNVTFGDHDRNHDHRWNYGEFQHANRYYYEQHPTVVRVTNRELRHDFVRMDSDGDGYIDMSQAQHYRSWD